MARFQIITTEVSLTLDLPVIPKGRHTHKNKGWVPKYFELLIMCSLKLDLNSIAAMSKLSLIFAELAAE